MSLRAALLLVLVGFAAPAAADGICSAGCAESWETCDHVCRRRPPSEKAACDKGCEGAQAHCQEQCDRQDPKRMLIEMEAPPVTDPPAPGTESMPPAIRSEIEHRAPAVRACYQRALRAAPKLAGRVDTTFTVAPKGKVRDVKAEPDTPALAGVARCVARTIGGWRLPSPGPRAFTVHHGYAFAPP